jgi:putative transposase
VDLRLAVNGIIFRLHTDCQWNQLPVRFGDDSTVHRHFQQWCRRGIWACIWALLVETCDVVGGVGWPWQAADAAMGKARVGGDLVGRDPTNREKGVKRRLVVEADGGPLGAAIAGANVHNTTLLAATLKAIVVEHPQLTVERPRHLCLDKGYDNPTGHETVAASRYIPHIRRIGEETFDPYGRKTFPARRWAVEQTLA